MATEDWRLKCHEPVIFSKLMLSSYLTRTHGQLLVAVAVQLRLPLQYAAQLMAIQSRHLDKIAIKKIAIASSLYWALGIFSLKT